VASLADRVRAAGGAATEKQMRAWTATAQAAQRRAIAGLWSRGAPVTPEQSFVRVLNGFAGSIDPTLLPAIERDPVVAGVYPVRAAFPAALPGARLDADAFGPASGRRIGLELPGFDGTGVTVALLDTGVDLRHPYLRAACCTGSTSSTRMVTRPPSRTRPSPAVPSATGQGSPVSWSACADRRASTASHRARR
jgi:subtilisin family serine protease